MFWIVWIMWICKILETSWNIEIIFFWTEVDEPKGCYTEWSESEKQISYINAYIWNREKWYWGTYLQGRNGDADVENGLMDTAGEGRDWESGTDMYGLPCVK